ncbi:cyclophilin family peptidyl-prolyl cis-trans isomerase [Flavobacterium sp. 7E]|uniref:peptidylprolyl isomerase n=1 Tax=Flavobacterium sp. 7E TaxID=2735898 RepID=UPI00156E39CE|nr:peptidylprolyl isomerase [Flavobacterium sp. 7E]NRS89185.1 cyclophilin family peptidyl-prolyl cis-trans isomerase [Flavobacterium sp. 7E]
MKLRLLGLVFLAIVNMQAQVTKKVATGKAAANSVVKNEKDADGIFATISTNKGDILLVLEYQKAPITVANFISLAEGKNIFVTDAKLKNKPFYEGLKFHRVINDFMIQTGDPQGNGTGGSGYAFKDEFTDLKFDKGGILAMANSGPASNSSQFFITHKDTPWLDNRHTIFGHVISGMDVVNKILQNDVMTKVTITRKGSLARKFDAPKVFETYFNNKAEDAKKEAVLEQEKQKKEAALELEKEKVYKEKFAPVVAAKLAYFTTTKTSATTTDSGLTYKIIQKGTGVKPVDGSTFYFHYAGYFEDGNLFDSSYEDVNKTYGKFDEKRAALNGYNAFPFQAGRKEGMIPGFIEALSLMSYGDKLIAFIPAKLAYGERGAGGVIPPNADLIFELELFDKQPAPKQ